MWLSGLIISVCTLFLLGAVFVVMDNSSFRKKHRFNLFYALVATVFLSALIMFFPIHYLGEGSAESSILRAILLSIFNSIQLFTTGCEFEVVEDVLASNTEWIATPYQVWAAVLFVLAPVLTFGFVLSIFKNLTSNLKYYFSFFKDVYVFSELNDKSLVLANDIKSNHKNSLIVFTDVFEENKESSFELIEKAKKLKAICFKNDILVVNFRRHSSHKSISFYAIGVDENENLNQSLKLLERYKNRNNTCLYVFSTSIDSELLLSSADKGEIKVRRINEVRSLIYQVLYNHGEVIFNNNNVNQNGLKDISAVVIGMGRHGTEMVKALSWFGQMDGYNLIIDAFDKDPLAEEKFVASAPELMSEKYNGSMIFEEAHYKITIHPGVDVDTVSFFEALSKINNATYVLVALGNDDLNINLAIRLRTHFERMGIHPVIQSIVCNSEQNRALKGVKNFRGSEYRIDFIGDMDTLYTEEAIMKSRLESEALERHLSYVEAKIDDIKVDKVVLSEYLAEHGLTEEKFRRRCNRIFKKKSKTLTGKEIEFFEVMLLYWKVREKADQDFWNYEYNYRSSIASAIHMKARIKCGIPGADKKLDEVPADVRRNIEVLEHKRWNAYMRANGYVFSGSTNPATRNDLAKKHHDLVPYSLLEEQERNKDVHIVSK